jgi:hypothetical protein
MRLSPERFAAWLNFVGQRFTWRRSAACPCINPLSGAADQNCPQCHGKGHIWGRAIRCLAGVANQSVQRQWAELGRWENGDVVLSIPNSSAMYNAGEWDRLMMLDGDDPFSIVLIRGQHDVLLYPDSIINRVFWLDSNKNIVEGKSPAVDRDGKLTWNKGGEPPTGVQYSISGIRTTEYFIYTLLSSDRPEHQGEPLPKRLVARRFDLYRR